MSGLPLETCLSNGKSVALTVLDFWSYWHLTPKNLGGHVILTTPLFEKFLRGHVRTVPGNMHVKFEVCSFNVLELLAFNAQNFRGHVTLATPISGLLTKYFLRDVKEKLCSKFGEDRSKLEVTILAIIATWMDTGRTDGQTPDDHRTDAKVILYSVQCCTLHWTDKKQRWSTR